VPDLTSTDPTSTDPTSTDPTGTDPTGTDSSAGLEDIAGLAAESAPLASGRPRRRRVAGRVAGPPVEPTAETPVADPPALGTPVADTAAASPQSPAEPDLAPATPVGDEQDAPASGRRRRRRPTSPSFASGSTAPAEAGAPPATSRAATALTFAAPTFSGPLESAEGAVVAPDEEEAGPTDPPMVGTGPRPRRRRSAARDGSSAAPPLEQRAESAADEDDDEEDLGGPGPEPADAVLNEDVDLDDTEAGTDEDGDATDATGSAEATGTGGPRRRRRGRRGRGRPRADEGSDPVDGDAAAAGEGDESTSADSLDRASSDDEGGDDGADGAERTGTRRRRRRRRTAVGVEPEPGPDDPPNTVVHVREPRQRADRADRAERADPDGVRGVAGSTRLEAKRLRRRDGRTDTRRRPPVLTESEFLARREAVERRMVVRRTGDRTQVAMLEDGVLVEHYVTKSSATSYAGNIYLGKVQNVLASMEAAFVDIGKGRNAVLYAGEVAPDADGGKPKPIEQALKSGQAVLVQVSKDPVGHKGARLTAQVSLPGRFLVYVPEGPMTGISRKLPDVERSRLKAILKRIVPDDAGVIIRTAAEGASEEELTSDVERLQQQWTEITTRAAREQSKAPVLLHGEPDLVIKTVRDLFNSDIAELVVQGDSAYDEIASYVAAVAPDLLPRVVKHEGERDVFAAARVDEGLAKALERKVHLPSGGSLVIDRTEALTAIDVNTGRFTGAGGNLEETVTRNNLEAAEEIARQLRLRDIGGMIIVDFIDMVLESNRDLVLRRLVECLGRDRTKHQVSEVTSLGLVQMTRKRVGQGLLEAFSEPCPTCGGRGVILHPEGVHDDAGSWAVPRGPAPRALVPSPAAVAARVSAARLAPGEGEAGVEETGYAEDSSVPDDPAGPGVGLPAPADVEPVDAEPADVEPADVEPVDAEPVVPPVRRRGRRSSSRGVPEVEVGDAAFGGAVVEPETLAAVGAGTDEAPADPDTRPEPEPTS